MFSSIHHIALIVSDYEKSKAFYTEVLGLEIIQEVYREERQSYKLDLALNGVYSIELFSFPDYKPRASRPEALGLRHLAFAVEDIEAAITRLQLFQVEVEPLRIDEYTGKKFTFFFDPDGLPLELYSI
ncbi:SMU1112c/YaeR family gloxylase I-like metalloprotein [Flavobacterium stagni]|uniref:VOC family protein n=1 Tax=Flavobacterium stagni TaxID=2506421 RepID=A0A4Q1K8V5_9FLAO|nr:VOC family protein [Flavobacterium stagni]RXR22866.1 VOC family protein [Flavobacterium stagni]